MAKLRLADLEQAERWLAENATAVAGGKMTVQDALKTYRTRLRGDRSLKPRTKAYREECISKLLRTWPKLEELDVRLVNKTARLDWAARLGMDACPSVFNHTVGTLKRIVEVAVGAGAHGGPRGGQADVSGAAGLLSAAQSEGGGTPALRANLPGGKRHAALHGVPLVPCPCPAARLNRRNLSAPQLAVGAGQPRCIASAPACGRSSRRRL